ncbi:MAG: hypothetical protein CMM01_12055 [Rhodopirellula sp.]|nr:hypothetical protein [Rhodopirellula sp.]
MVRLLFFALLGTHMLVQAGEKPTQKVPVWSVHSSSTEQLETHVDYGWFSIRPPKNYVQAELDATAYEKAGIKIAAWTMASGRAINPAITIMSIPPPRVPAKNDEELFEGILKSLTARWPEVRGSKITQGRWNGRTAYRYEFSVTSKKDNITGIVFAEITPSCTFVVSALHPVNTSEDRDAIKALELAAISCKRN